MPSTIHNRVSAEQFKEDVEAAETAAQRGPVFLGEADHPSYVLLSMQQYTQLGGRALLTDTSISDTQSGRVEGFLDRIAMRGGEGIDFDPPRRGAIFRLVDLS